jgi:polyhydroxyalkanoate depolymerase
MRDVYPGFLQLNGFISMNLDRHMDAHKNLFKNLVKGDGDLVDKHRDFYDEYLAVMDLTAEYYLQTVDLVFVKHALPKGEMTHRGKPVDPSKITRVALMTVEGENDAEGRRTLRRVQRIALQIGNRAAHFRFHGVVGECEAPFGRRGGINPLFDAISRALARDRDDRALIRSTG